MFCLHKTRVYIAVFSTELQQEIKIIGLMQQISLMTVS